MTHTSFKICALCITAIMILTSFTSAHANLLDENGEVIPKEGPRDRYTREQIIPFALKEMPGELIADKSRWEEDNFIHLYTIETKDGSVYVLEYEAYNGALIEIEAKKLSKNPTLPSGLIPQAKADEIATRFTRYRIRGALKPRILSKKIDITDNKLRYIFKLQKGAKRYAVEVDAFTGKIVRHRQMRLTLK